MTSTTLVNIHPLFEWLAAQEVMPRMNSVGLYSKAMAYFDTSIEDVLLSAIEGTLTVGYQSGATFLDSFYVYSQEFESFMSRNFDSKDYGEILIEKAQTLTGLSEAKLMALRKQGRFRPPRWSRAGGDRYVQYEDVLALRRQTVSPNYLTCKNQPENKHCSTMM